MAALRAGKRVVLEVAPAAVAAFEQALTESLPPDVRERIRLRGTEAVERSGCITLRTTRKGVQVGLYRSAESFESDPELPYTTVCETHSTLVSHETRRAAEQSLSHPEMWCDDCRYGEGNDGPEP
jgi:hypothetical protein